MILAELRYGSAVGRKIDNPRFAETRHHHGGPGIGSEAQTIEVLSGEDLHDERPDAPALIWEAGPERVP